MVAVAWNPDRLLALAEAAHAEQTVLISMGRLASPQEIADVAVFLLSERASYLTGQALMVEGGALRSLL